MQSKIPNISPIYSREDRVSDPIFAPGIQVPALSEAIKL